jgi:hypothetical protein
MRAFEGKHSPDQQPLIEGLSGRRPTFSDAAGWCLGCPFRQQSTAAVVIPPRRRQDRRHRLAEASRGKRRQSSSPTGCQPFGEDSVLERGPMGKPPVAGSVRPGLHTPAPGVPVTWWDPATLTLEVEEMASLRHQRLLQADAEGTAAAASEENYQAWKQQRHTLLAKAADPSLHVRTVTSLVNAKTPAIALNAQDESAVYRVEIETVERHDLNRPGGEDSVPSCTRSWQL